jgi:hypothetical protein
MRATQLRLKRTKRIGHAYRQARIQEGDRGDRHPQDGSRWIFLPEFISRQTVGAAVFHRLCSPVSSAPHQSICEKCVDICVSFLMKMPGQCSRYLSASRIPHQTRRVELSNYSVQFLTYPSCILLLNFVSLITCLTTICASLSSLLSSNLVLY